MAEILWKILAWVLSREFIANRLILRAMRTPDTPILARDGEAVMMHRYWLFNAYDSESRTTRHSWLPLSIRVHHILRPDDDPHLHDHPWNARSIVLMGGYFEQRPAGVMTVRLKGSTRALKFNEFHRISHVDERIGAVTLFIMGKYRGKWGFKIPYSEYLAQRT